LEDAINILAERAKKVRSSLATEEATKNALIMPFIQVLGYDVFNPLEVVPEFIADVAGKKGEKVDYAIMQDDKPIMIIECKACGAPLDNDKREQLHRYFLTLESSIGILTDGIRYLFFSRSEDGKKMDSRPFMELNLENVDKTLLPELRKLCKGKFDLKTTLETVSELRYNRHIKTLLEQNIAQPDEDFIGYFVKKADLRATQKTVEMFTGYVKRAFVEFLSEQINARLKTALSASQKKEEPAPSPQQAEEKTEEGDYITDAEQQAFYIVKATIGGLIDLNRVSLRNTAGIGRSTVVLDDTIRKPLVRLVLDVNRPDKWSVEIVKANKETQKVEIRAVDDIFPQAEAIREALKTYENKAATPTQPPTPTPPPTPS
jgi:hypothetical protein